MNAHCYPFPYNFSCRRRRQLHQYGSIQRIQTHGHVDRARRHQVRVMMTACPALPPCPPLPVWSIDPSRFPTIQLRPYLPRAGCSSPTGTQCAQRISQSATVRPITPVCGSLHADHDAYDDPLPELASTTCSPTTTDNNATGALSGCGYTAENWYQAYGVAVIGSYLYYSVYHEELRKVRSQSMGAPF